MASLVMAALPVQIAAPILLMAARMSPISTTYTAAVDKDWGPPSPARCGLQISLPWFIFFAHWRTPIIFRSIARADRRAPGRRSRSLDARRLGWPRRPAAAGHVRTPAPIACEALEKIRALFDIETTIRGRDADERRVVWLENSRPLVEANEPWLREKLELISQKSKLAETIRYALSRWKGLTRFIDDGRVEIDSNVLAARQTGLFLKPSRLRLKLQLARIVANNADVAFRESSGRFGFDLECQLYFSSLGPLEFQDDSVEDRIEGLHRPFQVDFDRAKKAARLSLSRRRRAAPDGRSLARARLDPSVR